MQTGLYGARHGDGAFVREVRFAAEGPVVRASLEDDMHHFVVELTHDGQVVEAVAGTPVRWPWLPCLESPVALHALVGVSLAPAPVLVTTDVSAQCTHQFDLAVWAIGFAHRFINGGPPERRYLAVIPDFDTPPFRAELWRNGVLYVALSTDGSTVTDPPAWRNVSWRGGFLRWAQTQGADDAEAALIVRRAVWLAPARQIDLEVCTTLADSGLREGICFASQPERMPVAFRNRGSLRDLAGRAHTVAR